MRVLAPSQDLSERTRCKSDSCIAGALEEGAQQQVASLRVQHHQPDVIPRKASHGAEPARAACLGQELAQRIVRFISGRAAL